MSGTAREGTEEGKEERSSKIREEKLLKVKKGEEKVKIMGTKEVKGREFKEGGGGGRKAKERR